MSDFVSFKSLYWVNEVQIIPKNARPAKSVFTLRKISLIGCSVFVLSCSQLKPSTHAENHSTNIIKKTSWGVRSKANCFNLEIRGTLFSIEFPFDGHNVLQHYRTGSPTNVSYLLETAVKPSGGYPHRRDRTPSLFVVPQTAAYSCIGAMRRAIMAQRQYAYSVWLPGG